MYPWVRLCIVAKLSDSASQTALLAELPVHALWGINKRWAAKLRRLDIATALGHAASETVACLYDPLGAVAVGVVRLKLSKKTAEMVGNGLSASIETRLKCQFE